MSEQVTLIRAWGRLYFFGGYNVTKWSDCNLSELGEMLVNGYDVKVVDKQGVDITYNALLRVIRRNEIALAKTLPMAEKAYRGRILMREIRSYKAGGV